MYVVSVESRSSRTKPLFDGDPRGGSALLGDAVVLGGFFDGGIG